MIFSILQYQDKLMILSLKVQYSSQVYCELNRQNSSSKQIFTMAAQHIANGFNHNNIRAFCV